MSLLTDLVVAVFDDRFSFPFTSGAGFSNYFPQPAYQSAFVDNYLDTYIGAMYEGLYNKSGRAYPEISASSSNFSIYWNGTIIPVSGTSASCPLMSSILALVNDALLAAERPVLGFLNVSLQSNTQAVFTFRSINFILTTFETALALQRGL
jgi:tripeptidyl-peptidase-1